MSSTINRESGPAAPAQGAPRPIHAAPLTKPSSMAEATALAAEVKRLKAENERLNAENQRLHRQQQGLPSRPRAQYSNPGAARSRCHHDLQREKFSAREIAGEVWKAIPGHPGYEASSLGRIRSIDRIIQRKRKNGRTDQRFYPGCILKPTRPGGRYEMVGLDRQQKFHVHRLVLLAFVGPCPPGMVVRHFPDDNDHNNRLENLRYGTRQENWEDSVRSGTAKRGEKNHNALLTEDAVREIRKSKDCYAVLAARYKVSQATILNVRNGRTWGWL